QADVEGRLALRGRQRLRFGRDFLDGLGLVFLGLALAHLFRALFGVLVDRGRGGGDLLRGVEEDRLLLGDHHAAGVLGGLDRLGSARRRSGLASCGRGRRRRANGGGGRPGGRGRRRGGRCGGSGLRRLGR